MQEEMTKERMLEVLRKICKEHLKYTYMFVIGFVRLEDDEQVYLAKKERQSGKEILLMKAGGKLHEYFKTIEKEEDIAFERVSEETRKKLWYFLFTDEEGNPLEMVYEYQPTISINAQELVTSMLKPNIEKFPLYVNEDGSIGKKIDLGGGGYIQVNDATMVSSIIEINNRFNNICEAFHNRLMALGVKAYRCNDGWVDRVICKMSIFSSEQTKGYYWFGKVDVGDKIFIGNAYDGGRFAEVLSVNLRDGMANVYYKPLQETLDGENGRYITKNNAPKYTFWDKLNGKKPPRLVTDIYEMWPIPERCCARCDYFNTERNFCFKGCRVEDCFKPTDCEWYGENEEIEDEEIPF